MKKEFVERMKSNAKIVGKELDAIMESCGCSYDQELTLVGAYQLALQLDMTLGELVDRYLNDCSPRWVYKRVQKDISENNADDILSLFTTGLLVNLEGRLYAFALGANKFVKREMISIEDHRAILEMFLKNGLFKHGSYLSSAEVYPQFEKLDDVAVSYLLDKDKFGIVHKNVLADKVFNKSIELLSHKDKNKLCSMLIEGNQKLANMLSQLYEAKNHGDEISDELKQLEKDVLRDGITVNGCDGVATSCQKLFEDSLREVSEIAQKLNAEIVVE